MRTQIVVSMALTAAMIGCSVEPPAIQESSVNELKQYTIERIGSIKADIEAGRDEGNAYGLKLERLLGTVQELEATLRLTGVGAESDLEHMLEAVYLLSPLVGQPSGGPPDHIAGGAEFFVEKADTLEAFLPILTRLVESMPDSDKRPPSKEERERMRRQGRQ